MSIKLVKKYSFTVYLINSIALFRLGEKEERSLCWFCLLSVVVFVLNFCEFSNLSAQFQGKKNFDGFRSELGYVEQQSNKVILGTSYIQFGKFEKWEVRKNNSGKWKQCGNGFDYITTYLKENNVFC